jgi:hypothetical protein
MPVVDVDDLYGLALDRFIPERASLVRELRSGGDREQATAVAGLRKPSVAAWAVNQLVRTQRREIDALFAAGDALRDVQAGVLGGSADARDLRSAAERERSAVDGLVATARGLLSSSGHELSAATVERVTQTLHAAALDDEARREVSEGRLVRELRHVGLGGGLGGEVAARAAQEPRARGGAGGAAAGRHAAKDRQAAKERQTANERKAAETAQRREREEARKQARALERDAAREVDRAQRALRTAEERAARATQALRDAEAAVDEAKAGVDAAVDAHRQAKLQHDGT